MKNLLTSTGDFFTAANGALVSYQQVFESIKKDCEIYFKTKGWYLTQEDREDILQDAFEKAIRSHNTFDPNKSSVENWSREVAHSIQIEYYRKYCSREFLSCEHATDDFGKTEKHFVSRRMPLIKHTGDKNNRIEYINPRCESVATGSYESDRLVETHEIQKIIFDASRALNDKEKVTFYLIQNGLAPKQMAEQMGCTPNAAATRSCRTRSLLRNKIDPQSADEYGLSA